MPAPREYHPAAVAALEAFARRAGYDLDDFWMWMTRRKRPPEHIVADLVETFWPLVRPEDFDPLPSQSEGAIDRHVNQAALARIQKKRQYGRPIVSPHPFAQALKAKGLTVTEWAADKGLNRSRVKSWMLDGDGGRPIPEEWAEAIRREFGVSRAAWKNGIRD